MRTALYEKHCQLNAKIVPFAGWEMPLYYQGSIPEHHLVREKAGVFDVSHMGLLEVSGEEAEIFLDYLATHAIKGHKEFSVVYTVLCLPNGGSVDDLLVFKVNSKHFFLVANAANRQSDLEHLLALSKRYDVHIQEHYETDGILAVQGPEALEKVHALLNIDLKMAPMHFQFIEREERRLIVSTTGYTGAGGCEIIAKNEVIVQLWEELLQNGAAPIGLGARDSLRLEKGYALYGHELSYEIAPIESVAAWTVNSKNREFQGKKALELMLTNGYARHAYGVILEEKALARKDFLVFSHQQKIGFVTSGGYSPTLDCSIALILVSNPLSEGEVVEIEIRKNLRKAKVVKIPFVK